MRIDFAGEVIVAFCSSEERSEAEEECAKRSHVIRRKNSRARVDVGTPSLAGGADCVEPVRRHLREATLAQHAAPLQGEQRTCHSSYGIAIEETVEAAILFPIIFDFFCGSAWQAAVDSWQEPMCLTQG
jgi:hypothetical protein